MQYASFDYESALIGPGQLAPSGVCLSSAAVGCDSLLLHVRPERMAYGAINQHMQLVPSVPAYTHMERLVVEPEVLFGANTAYDAVLACNEFPWLMAAIFEAYSDGKIVDVLLNQRLIDNAEGKLDLWEKKRGYSLASLGMRYGGRDRTAQKKAPDAWRLRYVELHDVDIIDWEPAAISYGIEDSDEALRIGMEQIDRHLPLLEDAPRQARAAFALQLMMAWGIRTNADQIDKLYEVSLRIFDDLQQKLGDIGFIRVEGAINPDTGRPWPPSHLNKEHQAVVKAYMIKACKEHSVPVKITDSGKKLLKKAYVPAEYFDELDKKVLKAHSKFVAIDADACSEAQDDNLRDYALRKKVRKLVETDVPDLRRGVDSVIQPGYNTMVASGRTSCRKNSEYNATNGFQFQNPLRSLDFFPVGVGVRECFEARPGTLFYDNDITGLEVATVAECCKELVGFSQLGELLLEGVDVHLWFGSKIAAVFEPEKYAGLTYAEAVEHRHEPWMKRYRAMAKPAIFGLPGGMGVNGFRGFARSGYGIKFTVEQAERLIQLHKDSFPEFVPYFRHIKRIVPFGQKEGTIHQIYSMRVRMSFYTSLCNSYFQGLGADAMKNALFEVARACYVPGANDVLYGSRPNGFVHDEIVGETTSDDIVIAHNQAVEVANVMEKACNEWLQHYPVRCEAALSRRFCKAESVYDTNGYLRAYDVAREQRMDVWYSDGKKVKWAA